MFAANGVKISIHAPREGSDTHWPGSCQTSDRISIHAPREGSDHCDLLPIMESTIISIHAPREGSDTAFLSGPTRASDFYPRSPRGERHKERLCNHRAVNFYPRSPRGERPPPKGVKVAPRLISIHAPREGSDASQQGQRGRPQHFYPRSPRGERLKPPRYFDRKEDISIHAPREGSDPCNGRAGVLGNISIHAPREGSDPTPPGERQSACISIHAPREGSDICWTCRVSSMKRHFYPRSPRGERPAGGPCRAGRSGDFYPRSPRGERQGLRVFRFF